MYIGSPNLYNFVTGGTIQGSLARQRISTGLIIMGYPASLKPPLVSPLVTAEPVAEHQQGHATG